MKLRYFAIILFILLFLGACSTSNNVSKIPHISLIAFVPEDTMTASVINDSAIIEFSLTDGDGDIGNSATSNIYLKDSRFDTFAATPFPQIDQSIEDAKYGLTGTCIFFPIPQPTPRQDSIHQALGDTFTYEFYITDRANNASNHIITHKLIVYK